MASYRQELKRIENRNKANEQLAELVTALKNVDKSIDDLKRDAEEQLMNELANKNNNYDLKNFLRKKQVTMTFIIFLSGFCRVCGYPPA